MRKNNKTRKKINKKRGGRVTLPKNSDNNNNDEEEYLNLENLTIDDGESDDESVNELEWYRNTVNSLFRFEAHSVTMRTRLIFESAEFNRLASENQLQPILQFYLESLLRILNDPQEEASTFRHIIIDRIRLIVNTELPDDLNENARILLLNLRALLIAALENLMIPRVGGKKKKRGGEKINKDTALKAFNDSENSEVSESINLPDVFIENLNKEMSNDKRTVDYNIDDLRRALNEDVYGVEMRVYPKPYPTIPLGILKNEPEHKYIGNIDYKIIGNPNPIAKVDEGLRQLSLYTKNDVLPYYTKEMDKNPKKLNPKSFNQHVKKRMLLYAPENKKIGNRKTKGGKEKKRKTRKKIYKKKKN